LQTSTRPVVARHRLFDDWPATMVVSSTVDLLQSLDVVPRYDFQFQYRTVLSVEVDTLW